MDRISRCCDRSGGHRRRRIREMWLSESPLTATRRRPFAPDAPFLPAHSPKCEQRAWSRDTRSCHRTSSRRAAKKLKVMPVWRHGEQPFPRQRGLLFRQGWDLRLTIRAQPTCRCREQRPRLLASPNRPCEALGLDLVRDTKKLLITPDPKSPPDAYSDVLALHQGP